MRGPCITTFVIFFNFYLTKINTPTSRCVEAREWAGFELFPQLLASLFVTANKRNTPDALEGRASKERAATVIPICTNPQRRHYKGPGKDTEIRGGRAAPLCADVPEKALLTLFTFKQRFGQHVVLCFRGLLI